MSSRTSTAPALLELRDLRTYFHGEDGVARAVDGINCQLAAGETLALVGESGSGKSVTALSILQLVPSPPGRIEHGQVLFRGEDLVGCSPERLQELRGKEIAMIFQEPMTALNPVVPIGRQVMEAVRLEAGLSRREARERAVEMLASVGIPSPEQRVDEVPDRLSGGMRQRVMIAMAMACGPSLLIADEPTTALDVTIQAQILGLLRDLQQRAGTGLLLITHDLGVVAETADHVAVMYAGKICESAPVAELFERPRHPYTVGLFASLPDPERSRLASIPGSVPSALDWPSGCRFRTRCPLATALCAEAEPQPRAVGDRSQHEVACHHLDEAAELRARTARTGSYG